MFSNFYSRIIYHKHRIISLIIITLFTTVIDIIKNYRDDNDFYLKFKNDILLIMISLSDGLVICFKHYLLEIKLFQIETVSFSFGFINFLFTVILMILQHFIGDSIFFNKHAKFINFEYRSIKDWEKIIISFIINSISFLFLYKCLQEFTPNHVLLTFILCRYISNLKDSYEGEYKLVYLILYGAFFVICFICILIFLEILELNFCNLNENTRRNILKRGKKEEKKLGVNHSINDSDNNNSNTNNSKSNNSNSNNSNTRESRIQDKEYLYNYSNDSKECNSKSNISNSSKK